MDLVRKIRAIIGLELPESLPTTDSVLALAPRIAAKGAGAGTCHLNCCCPEEALCQTDMAFVNEKGKFREQHGFATPEQRRAQMVEAEEYLRRGRGTEPGLGGVREKI